LIPRVCAHQRACRARADQIKVLIYDNDGEKKEYTGRSWGKTARTDIAVVRIHGRPQAPFRRFWGDSNKVKVGDWANCDRISLP